MKKDYLLLGGIAVALWLALKKGGPTSGSGSGIFSGGTGTAGRLPGQAPSVATPGIVSVRPGASGGGGTASGGGSNKAAGNLSLGDLGKALADLIRGARDRAAESKANAANNTIYNAGVAAYRDAFYVTGDDGQERPQTLTEAQTASGQGAGFFSVDGPSPSLPSELANDASSYYDFQTPAQDALSPAFDPVGYGNDFPTDSPVGTPLYNETGNFLDGFDAAENDFGFA